MARPRRMEDEQILEYAREVFLEHGASASTTLVAKRCGLSQAALFKRFGDKRTLLVRALLPAQPPFVALLAIGPQEGPLRPQLIRIAHEIVRWFQTIIPCITTLSSCGLDPHDLVSNHHDVPPPLVSMLAMTAWIDQARDRLQADIPSNHLATQFLGSLHVREFMRHIAGPQHDFGDAGPYVENVVDVFLKGAQK